VEEVLERKLWSAEKVTIPAGSAKLVKVRTEGNWKGAGVVESLPLEDQVKGRKVLLLENAYDLSGSIQAVVNTNSKYKEDNFTDSNAVAYSQDMFIYFLHEAPTCQTPLICFPLTPLHIPALSQVRRVELVTALTQGAS